MKLEKKFNIKDFAPIDDKQLINDLDELISDSHLTGYPQNANFLTEFFVEYGVYTKTYDSDFDKSQMIEKTKKIAPHLGFGYNSNPSDKKKPFYILHINMTTLGQKNPTLYREISDALEGEKFSYYFSYPNGQFIRPSLNNEENRPDAFYKFDDLLDHENEMSDKMYTYTKELQFFADKEDLSYDAKDMCVEGAKFFQNLGLLDKGIHAENTFELANNIRLEIFDENRVAFGINLENIKPQNFLITVGCGMGRENFTEQTIKIEVSKDFRSVLLKQGIRLE